MPTPEQFEQFIKTAAVQGLGFVFLAGVVGLLLYGGLWGIRSLIRLVDSVRSVWLPKLVSGHLTFLEHTQVATAATSSAVERLTESYAISSDNHGKTHRALECIVKAQQVGEVCEEAREYLEKAIEELK